MDGNPASQTDQTRSRLTDEFHPEMLPSHLYGKLRRQAERHLRHRLGRPRANLTWQPTALVNETILRMIRRRRKFNSTTHYFALATTVMKRVLIDYIRERLALKRGGGLARIEFDPELHEPLAADEDSVLDMEALFKAIDQLAKIDSRSGEVAWMRLAWGLTIQQIADSLQVSRASVERDWRFSQAWLKRGLSCERRSRL